MSGKYKRYLVLQLKRALKLIPRVLGVTLLLGIGAGLAGRMLSDLNASDAAKQKIEIGVVGDTDNSYLQVGIFTLESMDSSRFSIKLREMEEQEAQKALRDGELTGYVRIPQNFVDGMVSGDHHPITFVTADGATGFGTMVTEEIASAVSKLLLETENAIYGAQEFTADHVRSVNPYDAGNALIQRYLWTVLNRDDLFRVQTMGAADSLSLAGYYLCGITVAGLLLWGIGCSPLFSRRSEELSGMLNASGLGAAAQTLSEFAAFCALLLVAVLIIGLLAGEMLPQLGIRIPELGALSGRKGILFCLRLMPVGVMIAAMQFLLYELFPGTVGGILIQFLNAVTQGYLAGCFYPSSFFPEAMRQLGAVFPAGIAMRFLKEGLMDTGAPWLLPALLGYCLLFLLIAAGIRHRRLSV